MIKLEIVSLKILHSIEAQSSPLRFFENVHFLDVPELTLEKRITHRARTHEGLLHFDKHHTADILILSA